MSEKKRLARADRKATVPQIITHCNCREQKSISSGFAFSQEEESEATVATVQPTVLFKESVNQKRSIEVI